jgi:putative ABC transport system permease protein
MFPPISYLPGQAASSQPACRLPGSTVAGFGAWLAYVPRLQAATGHVIDPLALPWQVIIIGMALAVITAMLAARHPARTVARVPVVAALSGRPPPAKGVHRSARKGLTTLAAGLVLLLMTGGVGGPGARLIGLIATATGMCLLTGVCVTVLGGATGPRSPVAVRIALRDLARYRARSGGGELRGFPGHGDHPGRELPVFHGVRLDRGEPDGPGRT